MHRPLFVSYRARAHPYPALVLVALLMAGGFVTLGTPSVAGSHGTSPESLPLGPDNDRFYFHVAKGFECAIDAAEAAGSPLETPMVYATNQQTDPCGATSDDGQTRRTIYNTGISHPVHLVLDPSQPIELEEGATISASVWLWSERAGGVSPSFTLTGGNATAGIERHVAASPELLPTVAIQHDGRVWQHFDVDFGAAPAVLGAGPVTITASMENGATGVGHLGVIRTGLGFLSAHQGFLDLPLDVQVDNPVDDGDDGGTEPPVLTWPPTLENSSVRPGVKHTTNGAQCTTNFVFRDNTKDRLYMGTAAHCVDGISYGQTSSIGTWQSGSGIQAELVFSTYDEAGYGSSDFALLLIPVEDEHKVHPASLGFGGPTGLALPTEYSVWDRVITFGNSGLRPGNALDAREGYVTGKSTAYTSVYLVTPTIPGDSGSGLMTADGKAIGAASTIEILPMPGRNHYSNFWFVLDRMNDNGWDLELVTWELFDDGALPPIR